MTYCLSWGLSGAPKWTIYHVVYVTCTHVHLHLCAVQYRNLTTLEVSTVCLPIPFIQLHQLSN